VATRALHARGRCRPRSRKNRGTCKTPRDSRDLFSPQHHYGMSKANVLTEYSKWMSQTKSLPSTITHGGRLGGDFCL
jgi:hypothetical protein